MIMKKNINLVLNGTTYPNISIVYYRYLTNHNLAIQLYLNNGEPLARITANTSIEVASDEAVIDTNNYSWVIRFIEDNKLGISTGKSIYTRFVHYPIFKMDLSKMKNGDV